MVNLVEAIKNYRKTQEEHGQAETDLINSAFEYAKAFYSTVDMNDEIVIQMVVDMTGFDYRYCKFYAERKSGK